jgi:hypothetical protein
VQTAQWQPIMGTPAEVPEPSMVMVRLWVTGTPGRVLSL